VVPGVVTVEMKTIFMQAATGVLRAEAKVLHRSATLAFCEGTVFNEAGEGCAHGTATFMYLRALPTPQGPIRSLRGSIDEESD
jgi:acyl-coenzyme A thioesterase PaaI-like protein